MSDETTHQPGPDATNGWVKAFHPCGLLVTLPVPWQPFEDNPYGCSFRAIEAILAAGFLPREIGLEAGEERDDVAYVVHGQQFREGETTPFVLLYSTNDAMKWSFLKVYLNKPEDIAAFESASGMRLNAIPVYEGQDKPQRGKSPKIVAAPRPFGVVYKQNPKYKEAPAAGNDNRTNAEKTARLFVRWADQKAPAPAEQPHDEFNGPGVVTQSQYANLSAMVNVLMGFGPFDVGRFSNVWGAANLAEIPASRYGDAVAELERVLKIREAKARG